MHKFLKLLLVIIFLWAISLPWALNYLSRINALNNFGKVSYGSRRSSSADEVVTIGIVACGEKPINETIILLKSIILSSIYFGLPSLNAILFADDEHLHTLDTQVEALSKVTKTFKFRYEIHPVIFPAKHHDEWKSLFKPCASQRLFMHAALPHIKEILYLDVDTLVVGDLRKIWSAFKRMSSEQFVGLVPEHEVSSIGWYNRFASHPYYPPRGLNSGVMLMNLTRLRTLIDWENAIMKSYKKYKDKIVYGDQDIINIIFYHRPDAVYLLPCSFNYRSDHCMYGLNCKSIDQRGQGIHIIHGNRDSFHSSKFPIFKSLYESFHKFDMSKDDFISDLVIPFNKQAAKQNHAGQNQTTATLNCDNIGLSIFKI